MMGSAGELNGRLRRLDIQEEIDDREDAVNDNEQDDARNDRPRCRIDDSRSAGRRLQAAKAAPDRPARRIAVIKGPSSRSIASPIRSATKISAPNFFIGIADWKARMTPSRNEISATIGSASAPTFSQISHTSFQRTVEG